MEPVISGKTAFRAYYAEKRFVLPGLRAEVSSRMSLGGTVVDYEHIHGIGDEVLKGIAVYEVVNGKIQNVWFFSP